MKRFFSFLLSCILIAGILYGILFIRLYRVSGDSMIPMLQSNSLIIIDTLQAHISKMWRGNIVVYMHEGIPKIKRIIGTENEIIIIKDGGIYLSKLKLQEPYLHKNIRTCVPGSCIDLSQRVFSVPENSYFILGDNRENSRDSRWCVDTISCDIQNAYYVSRKNIIGKYLLVLPSF